ncbi:capsule biosynthesis phosphatase [Sphingomonas vulcanisoli]|uniref:Capsule biosynthesis phosphatase n=1 Tax=Sphingomonas vulcanisoli TaxID=1658060 RepID=A0ABX0TU31_9SPHN|nr:HAD hydrolase family protein [Sphingomonas vulcanisoli]NIJ07985.1 capsule biosynthesis phosphatase [Sphingomonas vulcanisoli]
MKRLVFDLDGTLTHDEPGVSYADKRPRADMVAQLRAYKAQGFTIIIASSRNMRTHGNSVGMINAKTLPVMFEWLARHDIPYDEVHIGKPWCGEDGFYIDDKAIRPSELRDLSYEQIRELLDRERS